MPSCLNICLALARQRALEGCSNLMALVLEGCYLKGGILQCQKTRQLSAATF